MNSQSEILEREKRWSLIAGIASVGAVALFFIGQIVGRSGVGSPEGTADFLAALSGHHSTAMLGAVIQGIATVLLAVPLAYLFFAALGRSDRMRRGLIAVVIAGPLFVGIGSIISTSSLLSAADQWKGDQTPAVVKCVDEAQGDAADEVTEEQKDTCRDDAATDLRNDQSLTNLAVGLSLSGALGFLIALMYTSLNAMRVGLLTRFWGSLGMAVGVLLIFPVLQYVALAWFIFLGFLIVGWLPGGRPEAWSAGVAVPWPVPGEIRQDQDETVIEGSAEEVDPPAGDLEAGEPEGSDEGPQGELRKRKKRN